MVSLALLRAEVPMYACICNAVTVDRVASAIDAGASSLEALASATSAGSDCSSCHDHLEDILEERCGACPLAKLAVA
jgi:bacterioferritin-associated ferredoxin